MVNGGIKVEQYLTIEEFNDLLKQWNGQKLKITKYELDDIDHTFLNLESISYSNHTRRIDDYQPQHVLELNGTGEAEIENHNIIPLPSSNYEIPLEDTSIYHYNNQTFSIQTDRARYIIELDR